MKNFTICSIPNNQLKDEQTYAFFYSGDYETIVGNTMKHGNNVKRYICITNHGKKVYKQYSALNGIAKGVVALDYESKCNLGVSDGDIVQVYSICEFRYKWKHYDTLAKISLFIALLSLILTIYTIF